MGILEAIYLANVGCDWDLLPLRGHCHMDSRTPHQRGVPGPTNPATRHSILVSIHIHYNLIIFETYSSHVLMQLKLCFCISGSASQPCFSHTVSTSAMFSFFENDKCTKNRRNFPSL